MQLIKILFFKQVTTSLKYRSLKAVIIYIDLPGMSFSMDTAFLHSCTAWNELGIVEIVRFFSRVATKDKENEPTNALKLRNAPPSFDTRLVGVQIRF